MISYDFSGKRYLVTGASSGIGAAISELISGAGGEVLLVAHNEEKLQAQAEKLGGCRYCSVDLSDVNQINAVLNPVIKEMGPFDGFVHSAGIGAVRPLQLCKYDYMKTMMDVNFFSFVEIVRLLTKKGSFNEGMSIVGISSVSSLEGNQSKTAYCA